MSVVAPDRQADVFRRIQLPFDERAVDDQFCVSIGELYGLPSLDLPAHRLEIPLHPVHADREGIREVEVLAVLGEHGGTRTFMTTGNPLTSPRPHHECGTGWPGRA